MGKISCHCPAKPAAIRGGERRTVEQKRLEGGEEDDKGLEGKTKQNTVQKVSEQ